MCSTEDRPVKNESAAGEVSPAAHAITLQVSGWNLSAARAWSIPVPEERSIDATLLFLSDSGVGGEGIVKEKEKPRVTVLPVGEIG